MAVPAEEKLSTALHSGDHAFLSAPLVTGTILLFVCAALSSGCTDVSNPPPNSAPELTGQSTQQRNPAEVLDSTDAMRDAASPVEDPVVRPPAELPSASNAATDSQVPSPKQAAPVRTRLVDDRPSINEARLRTSHIQRFESRRLVLLSDLPSEQVAHLPALADQLFDRLEQHFGRLPPASDHSEFQVTGCLIQNEDLFRSAGLMPSSAFSFRHGRHRNYQFWMFNTEHDYYRRHLLFHEFVHCFMTCESGMQDIPPLWYIEGMAEYFATHRLPTGANPPVSVEFGIMPEGNIGFDGWGRISELQRSFTQPMKVATSPMLKIASLSEVMPDAVSEFQDDFQYASSWALCWLVNRHPVYSEVFRPLSLLRTRQEFVTAAATLRGACERLLKVDWLLFCEALEAGYDADRSFPVHCQQPLSLSEISAAEPAQFTLHASRDWQDTGLRLKKGAAVRVICNGRCIVNDKPKPWVSEPQGVSVEYFRGRPLGQVVAVIVSEDGESISARLTVGRDGTLTAPVDGSLWLQVNDSSGSRFNNDGTLQISMTPQPDVK